MCTDVCACFTGTTPKDIATALTKRTLATRGEVVVANLKPSVAAYTRDALSKVQRMCVHLLSTYMCVCTVCTCTVLTFSTYVFVLCVYSQTCLVYTLKGTRVRYTYFLYLLSVLVDI